MKGSGREAFGRLSFHGDLDFAHRPLARSRVNPTTCPASLILVVPAHRCRPHARTARAITSRVTLVVMQRAWSTAYDPIRGSAAAATALPFILVTFALLSQRYASQNTVVTVGTTVSNCSRL